MEKKYYKVSYQHSESVYCSNIAHAESVEAVEAHYSKYSWCSVSECEEWERESAQRRGMPIVEIETAQPEETAQQTAEADQTAEKLENARQALEARADRSAWERGVTAYALALLEQVAEAVQGGYITAEDLSSPAGRRAAMLNGAADWFAYSWGGSDLQWRHCRTALHSVRTQAHPWRRAQTQQPGRMARHPSPGITSGRQPCRLCNLQQNAPAIAENAIRRRLWFNIPFSATVCHAADHAAEWHHCNPVELSAAVWQILTAASSRIDTTALKKELPEVAAKYTKTTETRRFLFA